MARPPPPGACPRQDSEERRRSPGVGRPPGRAGVLGNDTCNPNSPSTNRQRARPSGRGPRFEKGHQPKRGPGRRGILISVASGQGVRDRGPARGMPRAGSTARRPEGDGLVSRRGPSSPGGVRECDLSGSGGWTPGGVPRALRGPGPYGCRPPGPALRSLRGACEGLPRRRGLFVAGPSREGLG